MDTLKSDVFRLAGLYFREDREPLPFNVNGSPYAPDPISWPDALKKAWAFYHNRRDQAEALDNLSDQERETLIADVRAAGPLD